MDKERSMKKTMHICSLIGMFFFIMFTCSSAGDTITVNGYFSYEDLSYSELVLEVHNTDEENGIYGVMFASNDDGGPWMTLYPPENWGYKIALIRYNEATDKIEAVIDGKAILTQLPDNWLDYHYGYFFYTDSDFVNGSNPIAKNHFKTYKAVGEAIQAMPIFVFTTFEMQMSPSSPYIPSGGGTTSMHLWVTKTGSPSPTGSLSNPYQLVEAGIARTQTSAAKTVQITAGKYYETFTTDIPCILKASGGVVTIGKLDYQSSTTLDLITLNTHLSGDAAFLPSWQDYERTDDIANLIGGFNPQPDIFGFQEIWDEDLFDDGVSGIRPQSGYPYGYHGSFVNPIHPPGSIHHSGLAIMSQYPLAGFLQVEYDDEYGFFESRSTKGWVQATIIKDGFSIGLFNTHTQADNTGGDVSARASQIAQLSDAINSYRVSHPSYVVFAMGDFNIYGHSSEYYALSAIIGTQAGGRDADRNSVGFVNESSEPWTLCDCNPLAMYFDDGTISGRLDYIFYFPSLDGLTEILPSAVNVLPFIGFSHTEDNFTTDQSSDHWSVHGQFKLIRP
jgi:endonuclease/exonuclease/phosphatase family metal-dependent hydrolase